MVPCFLNQLIPKKSVIPVLLMARSFHLIKLKIQPTLGIIHLYLHAQVSAVSFYEKRGFKISGDVFDEAGIPHQEMELNLDW